MGRLSETNGMSPNKNLINESTGGLTSIETNIQKTEPDWGYGGESNGI